MDNQLMDNQLTQTQPSQNQMTTPPQTPESEGKYNLDGMIREKLRQSILSGEVPSGTHLSELKLSKEYGVSRTPVREALCALCADGLIEMIPNRGAFVKTPSPEAIQENRILLGHLIALTARQACAKLAETDTARLERLIEQMAQPGQSFESARHEIHTVIERAADMPALERMLAYLTRRLPSPVLPMVAICKEAEMVQQGYNYFLAALKRDKPDTAEKAMRDIMALNFSVTDIRENRETNVA